MAAMASCQEGAAVVASRWPGGGGSLMQDRSGVSDLTRGGLAVLAASWEPRSGAGQEWRQRPCEAQ
jgi:hypothetical protein